MTAVSRALTNSDPACPVDERDATVCDGDTVVMCQSGYYTERHDCRETGEYCVDMKGRASCGPWDEVDPLCSADRERTVVCDGSTVVECTFQYRSGQTICPAGYECFRPDIYDSPCFPID